MPINPRSEAAKAVSDTAASLSSLCFGAVQETLARADVPPLSLQYAAARDLETALYIYVQRCRENALPAAA